MPTVVTDRDAVDPQELCALYATDDWWDDRTPGGVADALAATDEVVAMREDGGLVAATRVLTDYAYYGTVYDVVVHADHRGEGYGEALMTAVREHPPLRSLPGLTLLCREGMVSFYESEWFERADDVVEHPDGDPEPLVRMTVAFDDDDVSASGRDLDVVAVAAAVVEPDRAAGHPHEPRDEPEADDAGVLQAGLGGAFERPALLDGEGVAVVDHRERRHGLAAAHRHGDGVVGAGPAMSSSVSAWRARSLRSRSVAAASSASSSAARTDGSLASVRAVSTQPSRSVSSWRRLCRSTRLRTVRRCSRTTRSATSWRETTLATTPVAPSTSATATE
jgi:GNAT superfamily N-acetyltransferase